jgi:hypothetical protein
MLPPKPPIKRSPQGILSTKPVYMRLMPDERRRLDELSAAQNRSISSVARLVYLEGIDQYTEKISGIVSQSPAKIFEGQ